MRTAQLSQPTTQVRHLKIGETRYVSPDAIWVSPGSDYWLNAEAESAAEFGGSNFVQVTRRYQGITLTLPYELTDYPTKEPKFAKLGETPIEPVIGVFIDPRL